MRRIAAYTRLLASRLGSSSFEAERLGQLAMLHDVGKLAIPDAILQKPGKLDARELAVMREHSRIGCQMLRGLGGACTELAANIALCHHERWDGSGYPNGLVGVACPVEARIVGVADVYDALNQERSYKRAWTESQVADHFRTGRGRLFDPEVVDALLAALPELRGARHAQLDAVAG